MLVKCSGNDGRCSQLFSVLKTTEYQCPECGTQYVFVIADLKGDLNYQKKIQESYEAVRSRFKAGYFPGTHNPSEGWRPRQAYRRPRKSNILVQPMMADHIEKENGCDQ